MVKIGSILLAGFLITGYNAANAHEGQDLVQSNGFRQILKTDNTIKGFNPALDGKFHLRALKFEFEPKGSVAAHNHTGPGIMCVTSGQLTSIIDKKEVTVAEGECVYDPGNVVHKPENRTNHPVTGYTFELLPVTHLNAASSHNIKPGMESYIPPH